jgi:hypothetical protein
MIIFTMITSHCISNILPKEFCKLFLIKKFYSYFCLFKVFCLHKTFKTLFPNCIEYIQITSACEEIDKDYFSRLQLQVVKTILASAQIWFVCFWPVDLKVHFWLKLSFLLFCVTLTVNNCSNFKTSFIYNKLPFLCDMWYVQIKKWLKTFIKKLQLSRKKDFDVFKQFNFGNIYELFSNRPRPVSGLLVKINIFVCKSF